MPVKQLLGIAGILLLVLVVMNLNNRLSEYFRLTSQRDAMRAEVTMQEQTREGLETRVAYANSDAAVEDWARDQGRMIQPGDKLIVPLTQEGGKPLIEATPVPTIRPVENWEVWWALFWGEER